MSEISIYETNNGNIEVRLERETVRLSQEQMAALFDVQMISRTFLPVANWSGIQLFPKWKPFNGKARAGWISSSATSSQ